MPLTYIVAGGDSPEYKSMICGRTEDIAEILRCLKEKRSVALFGERRIGKTSLLYLLRDLINGDITHYQHLLLDQEFASQIAALHTKIAQCKVLYLNLQLLPKTDSSELTHFILAEAHSRGLLSSPSGKKTAQQKSPSQAQALPDVFMALDQACGAMYQLVILIDEMEVLQDFVDRKQVLRIIRGVIQKCPSIHFVLTGAESWYSDYREKSSPIHNTVDVRFLTACTQNALERYLIEKPLTDILSPAHDSHEITPIVQEWTGGKPYYVQAICDAIVTFYQKQGCLSNEWKTHVVDEVYRQRGNTIRDAYIGGNIDELSQKILILLANHPNLTQQQIATLLGYSEKIIATKLADLLALYKIREHNTKYRIAGLLIEQWGKKNLDTPQVHNPWPQRIRWAAAVLILLLALSIFAYIHPPQQSITFAIPHATVSVEFPASVEQDETGTVTVSVLNSGSTVLKDVQITLDTSSGAIDYTQSPQNSNLLSFDSLAPGEKESATLSYRIRGINAQNLNTQVHMTQGGINIPLSPQFTLQERFFPFQKYLGWIGAFLTVIIGFIAKPDLPQLMANLISQVLPGTTKT